MPSTPPNYSVRKGTARPLTRRVPRVRVVTVHSGWGPQPLTTVNSSAILRPVHPCHPKKEVNEALDHAEQLGHLVERTASGHKWGRISCAQGHRVSVWSTPRSPGNHARDLRKWAEQHAHLAGEQREAKR